MGGLQRRRAYVVHSLPATAPQVVHSPLEKLSNPRHTRRARPEENVGAPNARASLLQLSSGRDLRALATGAATGQAPGTPREAGATAGEAGGRPPGCRSGR